MRTSPLTKQKKSKTVATMRHVYKNEALKRSASPVAKKVKRYLKQGVKAILLSSVFHSTFKIISTAIVVVAMVYGSYLYVSKTFANEVVVSQSEIVARVGKLALLPNESPYEIVRVQDWEDLQKQNPFYKDVKEGDYILMYKNLAVIYDLRNNTIVAIKR